MKDTEQITMSGPANRTMLRSVQIRIVLFLLFTLPVFAPLMGQVGVHTDFPDASSAMEIYSTNRGLLIPRLTLSADLSSPSPVTSPATGLLIFNSGSNQPIGFYYWNGSQWTAVGSGGGGGDGWSLTGNAGTSPGTNFLGTTDAQHFTIRTNNSERMRIESDGQVLIGTTAPFYSSDLFTVVANATQNYGLVLDSPLVGAYTTADRIAYQSNGGKWGLVATLDSASGFPVWGRNIDPDGYAIMALGSNAPSTFSGVVNHSSGVISTGSDGIIAMARGATKTGVIATGNFLASTYTLSTGSGGAFAGNDGIYSLASSSSGTGVIGVGNNISSFGGVTTGCGGAFTGYHGVYGKGVNTAAGTGIVGVGNNGAAYLLLPNGSGATFVGNDGMFAKGTNSSSGNGIIGVGNNQASYYIHPSGTGGAFTGFHGLIATSTDATTGTGVIGVGNNAGYTTLPNGSGGAFIGTTTGLAAWGSNSSSGTGVMGAGNNYSPSYLSTGSGGAFTGNDGVFANAANASTGTAIIGVGNNISSYFLTGNGGGAAFTGASTGLAAWATTVNSSSIGIFGQYNGGTSNQDGIGIKGVAVAGNNRGYGVYGQGNRFGVYANGNMGCSGTKPFYIDHPQDPENKILRHFAIESPEILNMYRGNVLLDEQGESYVQLPGYFLAANINFSYQITPIGSQAPGLYISEEINDNGVFRISGGNPGQKISWVVYAERNDLFVQQEGQREVEILKDEEDRGKYIMPKLYNQPEEKGMFYSGESIEYKYKTASEKGGQLNADQSNGNEPPEQRRNEMTPLQVRQTVITPAKDSIISSEDDPTNKNSK